MAHDTNPRLRNIEAMNYITLADTAARLGLRELAIAMINRAQEEFDLSTPTPGSRSTSIKKSNVQQDILPAPTKDIK